MENGIISLNSVMEIKELDNSETSLTVDAILEEFAAGKSMKQMIENYPYLTPETVYKAFALAANALLSDVAFSIVAGTDITPEFILEKLADGKTIDQVIEIHPLLTHEKIREVLAYAAVSIKSDRITLNC